MLTDLSFSAIEYICLNMREVDRQEIYGILDHDNALQLSWEAFSLLRNKGRCRIAWHAGKPAAWIGLIEPRPKVWEITMAGTDDLKAVAFECMRWARDTIPELIAPPHNGRRLQCDSRVGHEEAHAFLRTLGAKPEGPPMQHYGKDGGAYQRFVWLFGENGFVEKGKAVGR